MAVAVVGFAALPSTPIGADDALGPDLVGAGRDRAAEQAIGAGPHPRAEERPDGRTTSAGDAAAGPVGGAGGDPTGATDRFVVRFDDGLDGATIDQAIETIVAAGALVVDRYESVFDGVVVEAPPSLLSTLRRLPHVAEARVDGVVSLARSGVDLTTTQGSAPWGLDRIDQRVLPLSGTYTYPTSGAGVTVYVIDSGIRRTHVDFAGRVPTGAYSYGATAFEDCNGHGTHVSGTIGGSTYGVAKSVSIVPIRVFDCFGSAFDSDIIDGLEWILANRAPGAPAVLNMSLGGAANANFDAAVQRVIDSGVTVVAAAGNGGNDARGDNSCFESPARIPAVITVGATNPTDFSPNFSNFGPCLDLFAPGVEILSAWSTSDTAIELRTGTSMAAPHVAGAAALLLGQDPTLTPALVAARIISDATTGLVTNPGPGSPNRLLFVAPQPSTTFTGLNPTRVLETRAGAGLGTIDFQYSGIGQVGPDSTTVVRIAGRGGVPATGASAVAVNISVTEPTLPSYLTAFPAGSERPNAATLTFAAGQTVSNLAIVPLGVDGSISLYHLTGSTHLIVDVLGWFPAGPSFTGGSPTRVLETRSGAGLGTADGLFSGIGPAGSASTTTVPIAGRAGVPTSGVAAVAVNISVTEPTVGSYVTAFPSGAGRPNAATLTFVPGQTVSNLALVPLGANGAIDLFNLTGSTHLVVDVLGWIPTAAGGPGAPFTGLNPARVLETRSGAGLGTIDGLFFGAGPSGPNSTTQVQVVGRGGVPPTGVAAVVVNISVTGPTLPSFMTAFPTGGTRPNAATLTFAAGQTVSNLAIVPVGVDGRISLYNLTGSAHLVVDVLGWFPRE